MLTRGQTIVRNLLAQDEDRMFDRTVVMNYVAVMSAWLLWMPGSGCQSSTATLITPAVLAGYEQKMADEKQQELSAQTDTAEVQRVGHVVANPDNPIYQKLKEQIPDPMEERLSVQAKLQAPNLGDADRKYYQDILDHLNTIDRAAKAELTLPQVIRKTLENSYTIRVQSYNPAVNAAQIVEAEAVFDATFFASASLSQQNTPSASTLSASDSSTHNYSTGLRKFFPTGGSAQLSWDINRVEVENFRFNTVNPAYRDDLAVTLSQPLLRGFGLDFNRSQINIAKFNRRSSEHQFLRQVRDQLSAVEQAYWNLASARRVLVSRSRLIAEYQKIYDYLYARRDFDASEIEITDAKARLDAQKAQFVRVKNNVKDAEDRLKSLINDPTLNLADDLEIIPVEFPTAEPIVLDRFAELQAALNHRSELKEAELAIESARIVVGQAKNQTLPRFDTVFRYTFDSLGVSQHDAFQNLSDFDFHHYSVGVEFEWPIGNRGPRAALRRARLQHAQSLAALKQTIESVILDVNVAIRGLFTSYEQIASILTSVESQIDQVQAIVDRAERRDPDQLNRELNARAGLASLREQLVDALLRYNLAITDLERAKDTLLQYNNVSITTSESGQP